MLMPTPTFGTSRGVLDSNLLLFIAGRDLQKLTAAATVDKSILWKRTPFFAPMAEA